MTRLEKTASDLYNGLAEVRGEITRALRSSAFREEAGDAAVADFRAWEQALLRVEFQVEDAGYLPD